MLVFKKKNRTLSQGYAAIFTCDDKKGNGELAKMENPKHDEWEKGWHPDAEKAASIKRSISLFINEKLRSLISETFRNESVIDGLEQLLGYTPDEIEDQKESGDEEEQFDLEQYQSNWEPIEYVPPKPEKKKPRKRKVKGDRGSGDDEGLGSGGPGDSQGGGGDTPGSEGFGDMDGGSKGDSKYKKLNDSQYSYRCFNDKSSNCFKLVISTKNTKTCNISFFSRGLDTDKNDVIQLESAVDSKSGESFKISSNTIANVETTIDPKIIDVEFADHKRYAVNIEIYG